MVSQTNDYITLNAKEKQKLAELVKEEEKAKTKFDEAEKILSSISNIDDEKEQQKIFEKALKKQIEGFDIRIKYKDNMYKIYSTKIYEFWSKFTGQPDEVEYAVMLSSDARDKYIEYLNYMNNIVKTNDIATKKNFYEKANRYLNSALLLIQRSFDIYIRIPLHPSHEQRLKNLQLMDSLLKADVD